MTEEKKRIIHKIKKININQADDFQYDILVGSGAFGKVRLCSHQKEDGNKSQDSTNSSDGTSPAKKPCPKTGKQMEKRSIAAEAAVTTLNNDPTLKQRRAIKPNEIKFAVKIQSKYQLIKGKQEEHLYNEIDLMNSFDHPFILPLRAVAQDKRIIFMFIDFMPCGDLMGVVSKFEKLSLELTRFYAG